MKWPYLAPSAGGGRRSIIKSADILTRCTCEGVIPLDLITEQRDGEKMQSMKD